MAKTSDCVVVGNSGSNQCCGCIEEINASSTALAATSGIEGIRADSGHSSVRRYPTFTDVQSPSLSKQAPSKSASAIASKLISSSSSPGRVVFGQGNPLQGSGAGINTN